MSEKDNEEMMKLLRGIEHDTHTMSIVSILLVIFMGVGLLAGIICIIAASGLTEPNRNNTKSSSSSSSYSSLLD